MRKTVILLLALCLLCAAVPALAEEPVRVRVSEVTHSVFYARSTRPWRWAFLPMRDWKST